MSLESKVSLLRDLEHGLSDTITAADLSRVLAVVSDTLQHYELEAIAQASASGSDDLFEAWLSALLIQNRSEKTVERYRYIVGRLLSDLAVPIRSITVYHLRSWLAKEKSRGIADSTLEGQRQIFSSFFGWLWREGLIEKNPVANLGAIKVPKKVREAYAAVDLEKLKSACDQGTVVVVNSQCLYEASDLSLYQTGQRVLETGAIESYDMTTEATVTKLMWALGQTEDPDEVRALLARSLAGEMGR